jgi:hypothetical protein
MDGMVTMPQLKERGWTRTMVRDLLGAPDDHRANPRYRSAAPMGLWAPERVAAAEAEPTFAQRQASSRRRSAVSAGAAARKRQDLLAQAARVPVRVPLIDRERLTRRTCASYNALHGWRIGRIPATPDSDPRFLERITVNYLRHELSGYEGRLAGLFRKVGRAEAEAVIRERVYGAISEAYPELAAECARQLAARRGTP